MLTVRSGTYRIIANVKGNGGVQVVDKKAYRIANSRGEFGAVAYESRSDAAAALEEGEHVVVVKVVGRIIPIAEDDGREKVKSRCTLTAILNTRRSAAQE